MVVIKIVPEPPSVFVFSIKLPFMTSIFSIESTSIVEKSKVPFCAEFTHIPFITTLIVLPVKPRIEGDDEFP